jgi:hypothetical protein
VTGWSWGQPVGRTEKSVRICLRGDPVADKEAAEEALVASRRKNPAPNIGDPEAVLQMELATEVERLQEDCEAASVTFRFRGLGRREHSDLVAAHPPTEKQAAELAEVGMSAMVNSETFPPALVAASCIEPAGVTLETATEAFEDWSVGQWTLLWQACLFANQGSSDPGPKSSIASAVLRGSAPS